MVTTCSCGRATIIKLVSVPHSAPIHLGLCLECDRRRCSQCHQTTGPLLMKRDVTRCDHCKAWLN